MCEIMLCSPNLLRIGFFDLFIILVGLVTKLNSDQQNQRMYIFQSGVGEVLWLLEGYENVASSSEDGGWGP